MNTEKVDNEEFKILGMACAELIKGRKDNVYLTAFVPMCGEIEKDIALVYICGCGAIRTPPVIKEGYNASFYCGRFLINGPEQILYSICRKNKKECAFYLYGLKDGMLQVIFDASDVKNNYSVDFRDGYKAVVTNNDAKEKYLIDLIYKKDLLKGLYDKNGILLKPAAGNVGKISGVFPFDAGNGRCGIIIYLHIAGVNGNDTLGYMAIKYLYNGRDFIITETEIAGRRFK